MQWAWTCLLCLSGSYGNLLDYVIFAVLIFYILTIVGLFVLRRTRPEAARPYRAFGYPVLPALYIVMAAWISVVLLRYKPQYTWPGLILVLLGVPVYLVWKRQGARTYGAGTKGLGRFDRMANLLAIKPMSKLMQEASGGGRSQPEALAGTAEPDCAGHRRDYRGRDFCADGAGRGETRGAGGDAELCVCWNRRVRLPGFAMRSLRR